MSPVPNPKILSLKDSLFGLMNSSTSIPRKAKRASSAKHVQAASELNDLAKLFRSVQAQNNSRLVLFGLGEAEDPDWTLWTLMDTHFPRVMTINHDDFNRESVLS